MLLPKNGPNWVAYQPKPLVLPLAKLLPVLLNSTINTVVSFRKLCKTKESLTYPPLYYSAEK